MYYWLPSAVWTNKDGTIDEVAQARIERFEKIHSAHQLRNRRRINMVTLRFKPKSVEPSESYSSFFMLSSQLSSAPIVVKIAKTLDRLLDEYLYEGLDQIPTILYEPSIQRTIYADGTVKHYRYVNFIEYIFAFLREKKKRKYNYTDYKQAITDFVEYFSIKPSGPKTNQMEHFEDLNGNLYRYDHLFYYLCKYTLQESRNQQK